MPERPRLSIEPVLSYPRTVRADGRYVLTVDLRLPGGAEDWSYPDGEEAVFYCLVNGGTLCFSEPMGEPAVVLHRFGGSYGPARFLLTAHAMPTAGTLLVNLVNGVGIPLAVLETDEIAVDGPLADPALSPPAEAELERVPESSLPPPRENPAGEPSPLQAPWPTFDNLDPSPEFAREEPGRSGQRGHETDDPLRARIRQIADEAGANAVGVALHDWEKGVSWAYNGDAWFHAASLVKLTVLLALFDAIERGDMGLTMRVHVRNRFLSVVDGSVYRIEASRDSNSEVHGAVGKSMKVSELAHHMIAESSNLATNLLIDALGTEEILATLQRLGLDQGIEFRRGVEDVRAYEAGINNLCTATGMLKLLRVLEEGRGVGPAASRRMLDILHAQEFRSGIPAGLPDEVQVANKTGEIQTAAHDVAIVYAPGRKPYALVVLTDWDPSATRGRSDTIARISRAVYMWLTEGQP